MSSPDSSALLRKDLRDVVAENWDQNSQNELYIANEVMPEMEVPHLAGIYISIERENYLKTVNTLRKEGGYSRSEFQTGTDTYTTQEFGHEVEVSNKLVAMSKDDFDAEAKAAAIALGKVKRDAEIRGATLLFSETTFTSFKGDVAVKWPTFASATPISDVSTARQSVYTNSGLIANVLILSWVAWENLRQTDQILDRFGSASSTDGKSLTPELVASILDIDRIIIGSGLKDTAKEGQTSVLASIWDTDLALVAHIKPAPTFGDYTLCGTAHWKEDGSEFDFMMESYGEPKVRADVVRARRQVEQKVFAAEAGYLLTKVLTKS